MRQGASSSLWAWLHHPAALPVLLTVGIRHLSARPVMTQGKDEGCREPWPIPDNRAEARGVAGAALGQGKQPQPLSRAGAAPEGGDFLRRPAKWS